tara:strand:+ start:426 stop:692 length:267 start_codon:yes stop_codon:yes gene_type:complete
MNENKDYFDLKKYVENMKLAQKTAYAKYYINNREKVIKKSAEYREKKNGPKEIKELTEKQLKKREYNKKYIDKKKENIDKKNTLIVVT